MKFDGPIDEFFNKYVGRCYGNPPIRPPRAGFGKIFWFAVRRKIIFGLATKP
jgi:hypothetical protein